VGAGQGEDYVDRHSDQNDPEGRDLKRARGIRLDDSSRCGRRYMPRPIPHLALTGFI
jgi:hypothetical protein